MPKFFSKRFFKKYINLRFFREGVTLIVAKAAFPLALPLLATLKDLSKMALDLKSILMYLFFY